MSKINKIKVNGTPYEVEDKEAVKTVTLTQAEYDALQTKDPSIFYVISDGQGGGGGMTSGEVQTMIDSSISGKADSSGVTQEISAATSGKVDTTTFNTYSGAVDTALSGKQETLVSGTNIKTINNESILGSGNITISGGGSGSSAVEVTQAEYDALVSGGTLDPSVLYIITDAVGGDLSNYMTSAQTMNAISAATSTKQDILSAGTGIDITDNTISVTGGSGGGKAVSGGTNISITTGETADTINCTLPIISSYDSRGSKVMIGYNDQQYIDYYVKGKYGVSIGFTNYINAERSVCLGTDNQANGYASVAANAANSALTVYSFACGNRTKTTNKSEHASGQYNNSVSASTTFGNSGNTLFSVGNGTADNARHNAFEIRQNGDIYITSGSTDIKLQDHLGGGGITSGEVQDMIDTSISGKQDTLSAGTNITITDNVISAQLEGGTVSRGDVEDMIEEATSGLVETSAVTSSVTSASTDTEIPTAKAVYDSISGKQDTILGLWSEAPYRSVSIGYDNNNTVNSQSSLAVGDSNTIGSGTRSSIAVGEHNTVGGYLTRLGMYVFGGYCKATNNYSLANGYYVNTDNLYEAGFGTYNKTTFDYRKPFGDSGNTLFSVGNGTSSARHNAFEIKQNGDIYITSGSTDIKLQDHLGGGGGSITIDPTLDSGSTNPVANSAITNAIDGKQNAAAGGYFTSKEVTIAFLNSSSYQKGYGSFMFNNSNGGLTEQIKDLFYISTINGKTLMGSNQYFLNSFNLVETSDITSAITSASTNSQVPSAKAVYDAISAGGGGGLDDDTQLLLSTALTDLNDRKADLSEVRQNYQRKGDYATKSELAAKANVSDVMTLEKAKENEQVTSYALNNLNNRVTDNTTALGGMKLVKITESEYAVLTTKDENTLYVVIADPE